MTVVPSEETESVEKGLWSVSVVTSSVVLTELICEEDFRVWMEMMLSSDVSGSAVESSLVVEALSETVTWLVMTDLRVVVETPSVVAVSSVEVSCSETVLELSLPVGAEERAEVSVLATEVESPESEVPLLEAEVVASVSAEVPEARILESKL